MWRASDDAGRHSGPVRGRSVNDAWGPRAPRACFNFLADRSHRERGQVTAGRLVDLEGFALVDGGAFLTGARPPSGCHVLPVSGPFSSVSRTPTGSAPSSNAGGLDSDFYRGPDAEERADREDRFRSLRDHAERRESTDHSAVDADFGETFTFELRLVTRPGAASSVSDSPAAVWRFVQVTK